PVAGARRLSGGGAAVGFGAGRGRPAGAWAAPGGQGRQVAVGEGALRAGGGEETGRTASEVGGADRRVRLGPQHAVHPGEGRQAARPDRVVLPLSADGGIA